MRNRWSRGALVAVVLMGASCDAFAPDAPADEDVLAGTIEGMDPGQVRQHVAGDEEFARVFSVADGLGPIFVAASCEQCHVGDAKGHPVFDLTRFGRYDGDVWDPLPAAGGPQLQHRAIPGYPPEVLPAEATGVARLTPPAVTGLGYLDAVDDATLLALADPDDADGDGVSGRVQLLAPDAVIEAAVAVEAAQSPDPSARGTRVDGRYIGRFGKKALTVNLLHQTVGAYQQDMGVTSDLLPEDLANPAAGGRASDGVADPEVGSGVVANVVFYLKTLRVPPRRDADHPDVVAGEALFTQVGCASCHVPTLRTGRSNLAVLDRVTFHPYTDLLLHDMGPELDDGYTEGRATTAEWRTPPLWGIGLQADFQGGQAFYLHDGRARTLEEAIGFHGGEGARSRAAFQALSPDERARLIRFLESL
ncbi:MAG: di-heme oxidoredictase family protein [Longimicrobiales bacterium]